MNKMLWIIIAIVALLLAVVIFFLLKADKKEEATFSRIVALAGENKCAEANFYNILIRRPYQLTEKSLDKESRKKYETLNKLFEKCEKELKEQGINPADAYTQVLMDKLDEIKTLTFPALVDYFPGNFEYQNSEGKNLYMLLLEKDKKFWAEVVLEKIENINAKDNNGNSMLHYAVKTKDLATLSKILKRSPDVNAANNNGDTPLHFAVKYADNIILEELLETKPQIDIKNNEGYTPLMLACIKGDYDMVKSLLDAGADVKIAPPNGKKLIQLVKPGISDYSEIVAMLVDAGADVK